MSNYCALITKVIEQNNQKWNEKSESHEDSRVSRSRYVLILRNMMIGKWNVFDFQTNVYCFSSGIASICSDYS